jgi:hypothetical protein
MAFLYIPPLKPVPENATQEDRQKMYEEYCAELIKCNPRNFNNDGGIKSFFSRLMANLCR